MVVRPWCRRVPPLRRSKARPISFRVECYQSHREIGLFIDSLFPPIKMAKLDDKQHPITKEKQHGLQDGPAG